MRVNWFSFLVFSVLIFLPLVSYSADGGSGTNYDDALFTAAKSGTVSQIDSLLKQGANINATDAKDKETPLHMTISLGVCQLMGFGGPRTSLADGCRTDVATFLVDKGVNINAKNYLGCTALRMATASIQKDTNSCIDLITLLVNKGADVNSGDDLEGVTPLMAESTSYYQGTKAVVELLIGKGANINAKSKKAFTAFYYNQSSYLEAYGSVFGELKEIAQLLIDKGAKDQQTINEYFTISVIFDHEDMAKLLLNKGADVNAHDSIYGATPLMLTFNNHPGQTKDDNDLIILLLDKGADVNAKDNSNATPLIYALTHYGKGEGVSKSIVELLLYKGADICANDQFMIPRI